MVVAALGKLRGQTGSSTMSHVFRNKNVYSILPYRYGAPLGLYIIRISIRLASKLELVLTRAVVVEERRRCGRPDARASCGLRDRGGAWQHPITRRFREGPPVRRIATNTVPDPSVYPSRV